MKFLDRIQELGPDNFDEKTFQDDNRLKLVFFWGHQCPNCEVAKRHLEDHHAEALKPEIDWYHVNTYHHADLGVRFGLHGIPTFLLFKNKKLAGKITTFPGWDPFIEVVSRFV